MKNNSKTLTVVKIGGNVIDQENKLDEFLHNFSQIEGYKILIHGGGKLASRLSERLGIESKMVDGRRITDLESLEVVTMVYGGTVNKAIVSKLQAQRINAIGVTGADGNIIEAHRRPIKGGIDFGYVGDIDKVNVTALDSLIEAGFVPVIAPLTHDGKGQLFNTNADTIAAEVSTGLSELYQTKLYYTFELDGVMANIDDPDSLIKQISRDDFMQMKESGTIHSGMIPKLENAFNALKRGINQLYICHYNKVLEVSRDSTDIRTSLTI